MQLVAQHLQNQALNRPVEGARDSFGRTAFNRYYYATFLKVQDTLRRNRPQWSSSGHSKLPRILRGDVVDELKVSLARGRKTGDGEIVRLCSDAISAAKGLADLLEASYAIRVIADYFPETQVVFFSADDFRLDTVTVREAHSWPPKAASFISSLERAWRQIND